MSYSKGQIITMNLDGTDREYRILTINGNIAEVVAMFSPNTRCAFNSNDVRTYAGSSLDVYLNSTWYNTLTAAAKAAIVSKTFNQDSWYLGTVGGPVYSGHYGTTVPGTTSYSISKGSATYGGQITRNVYALSVQDVIDYITNTDVGDGKLENYNIWKMFWNTTTHPSISEYLWLRSASASNKYGAWYVDYNVGYVDYGHANSKDSVRPAFTIDLSKILPSGYSITYHANDGTPEPENLTGQTNLPNPLPTLSKTNHTFDGWFTDSTFTTPAVAGATISANTDLYAKFTRSQITLDLSTIGLSEGTHSIQMKLSDDGVTKADSELSNAVSYEVQPAPQGETWLLNEFNGNLTASAIDVNIQFTSNNTNYTRFRCIHSNPGATGIYYDNVQVWNLSDDYINQAYRTVTFANAPTGDLLTWLQANAVKQ